MARLLGVRNWSWWTLSFSSLLVCGSEGTLDFNWVWIWKGVELEMLIDYHLRGDVRRYFDSFVGSKIFIRHCKKKVCQKSRRRNHSRYRSYFLVWENLDGQTWPTQTTLMDHIDWLIHSIPIQIATPDSNFPLTHRVLSPLSTVQTKTHPSL